MPQCTCAAKHTVVTLCVCALVTSVPSFFVDFGQRYVSVSTDIYNVFKSF